MDPTGPGTGSRGPRGLAATVSDGDNAWWDPLDPAKITAVQNALHVSSAISGRLPLCRDTQTRAINEWLGERLRGGEGGGMYVSGLPGTGKSLTVLELVRQCGRGCHVKPTLLAVNCMHLSRPQQVTARLLAGYRAARSQEGADPLVQVQVPDGDGGSAGIDEEEAQSALRRLVVSQPATAAAKRQKLADGAGGPADFANSAASAADARGREGMIVAVLDEMDGLLGPGRHGDAMLGQLFSLAHATTSRLILVGIANSIDLVQNLTLPGGTLHRHNIRPAHVTFPPYTHAEISTVITQRLQLLPGPVFDPKAIELCASKIGNSSGDMRRALQAVSTAVASARHTGPGPRKRVDIRGMHAALLQVTGGIGISNVMVTAIQKLPVPQQLLMAAATKLLSDRLGSRGLAVKIPSGIVGQGSGAARFIGGTPKGIMGLGGGHQRHSSAGHTPGSTGSKTKGLTLDGLREAHAGLCKRVGVQGYTPSEFATAMDILVTLGLLELKGGTGRGQQKRVTLAVAEDDVAMALADVPVLKNVM